MRQRWRASTEVDEVEKYLTDEAIDIDALDRFPNIKMVYRYDTGKFENCKI